MLGKAVLLLAAAAALAAPAALADGLEGEVGPTPLCDVASTMPTCSSLWYRADAGAWVMCLVATDPTTSCFDAWCTLDNPPSYCRLAFAEYGFRGYRGG